LVLLVLSLSPLYPLLARAARQRNDDVKVLLQLLQA